MREINPVLIQSAASRFGLPPKLITAIIAKESSGNPWAWNPEPHYIYFWDVKYNRPFRKVSQAESANERPPADFPTVAGDPDQEWWGQQASWGLMQPMGAVARECGFTGAYLPELCEVELNIHIGCTHLRNLKARFIQGHGWEGVISAFNQGGPYRVGVTGQFNNQSYVNWVMQHCGGSLP